MIANFSGASRDKVLANIMVLVNEFGQDSKAAPEPEPVHVGPPDLGFWEFQHDNMTIQKYDSVENVDKMAVKVAEIVNASAGNEHLKDIFKGKLVLSNFNETHLKELFDLIKTSTPESQFPLFDLLRCAFLGPNNALSAVTTLYENFITCL